MVPDHWHSPLHMQHRVCVISQRPLRVAGQRGGSVIFPNRYIKKGTRYSHLGGKGVCVSGACTRRTETVQGHRGIHLHSEVVIMKPSHLLYLE